MSIVTIIIVLVIIGVIMWLINRYIPMAGPIKTILNVVVLILVIYGCFQLLG